MIPFISGVLFLQFRVILMSFRIPLGLFVDAFLKFFCKIYPRLIGKTDENPENVSHFLS